MTNILSLNLAGLEAACAELGWERYRARQLYSWLWQKGASDFDQMTNLARDKRNLLKERFTIALPAPVRELRDPDGTRKFTLELEDKLVVEAVYIPETGRRTVCVSTQVGCALACAFCRTGQQGFKRNLAWHEIAGQVLAVKKRVQGTKGPRGQVQDSETLEPSNPRTLEPCPITNVVFMGMGEPFLNYDATVEAATNLNLDYGLGIGARRITISTSGIPEGIRRYADFPLQTKLAISLNASDNETRDKLMPVNKLHPLEELFAAIREYVAKKNKRVTFEYVLIDGMTNRRKDAYQLARLLKGIPCKVNLIPLNPVEGSVLRPPTGPAIEHFRDQLYPLLPAVTVRKSRGQSILAACGQLAGS